MSFFTGTQSELLYVMPAAVTKNTYTTIAAFSGVAGTNTVCSIPPGFLTNENPNPVGKTLLLEAFGTIATTAAATFAVNLNINPTVATSTGNIAVAGALAPTAAVTCPFHLKAYITCSAFATSTATYQINGTWRVESVASGGVPTAAAQCSGFSGSIASLDPRVTQYVELFGTWSASAAGNTTTLQQMLMWGLN
jgi:hypothetical protein